MVRLSAENAKSENDFTGNSKPVPGRYHVIVQSTVEKGSKKTGNPGVETEFQVLAGTNPGEAGKVMPLFLSYVSADGSDAKTKTCLDRVTRLALCTGVLQPGQAAEVNWDEAIGRELVIEIEAQEYEAQDGTKKQGSQVAFMGFWGLGNPAVADVPRDEDSPGMAQLKASGKWPPTGNGNGSTSAAAKPESAKPTGQAKPTTAAGNATGKRDWSKL